MKYEINELAKKYAARNDHMLYLIQSILNKLQLGILDTTQTSISFIPWRIPDQNSIENEKGVISWNAITNIIRIQYQFQIRIPKANSEYSRVLKWYFTKWNEEYIGPRSVGQLNFIYPGNTYSEVILQTSIQTIPKNLDSIIRNVLIYICDTIETEIDTIASILSNETPYPIKQELLKEIRLALTELSEIDS